jgi:predicted esterase YcpF (UPF0227 family)
MILYLHGFRSSPSSFKARMLAERIARLGNPVEFRCPQLPASPRAAAELALAEARRCRPEELCLIGSSLGGFYATWLAEQTGCRAVLLNPAVHPWQELRSQIGTTTAFHSDAPFEFRPEYVAELETLAVKAITRPERYFLVAASGDELLDWREMVAHFPGAHQLVIEGSDHGMSDFGDHIGRVLEFCGAGGNDRQDNR